VPHLCELYPGICLTTEEKARKNFSQGKKNLSQVKINLSQSTKKPQSKYIVHILPKAPTHYKIHNPTITHITKSTHTHIHTHALQNNIQPPQYNLLKTKCIHEKQPSGEKEQYLVSNVVNLQVDHTIFNWTFTSLHCTSRHFTNHKYPSSLLTGPLNYMLSC
jgi:hypothetical protein